jgi:hypothetical protein
MIDPLTQGHKQRSSMVDIRKLTEELEALSIQQSGHTKDDDSAQKTFTLFPLLAAELRLKIWSCAQPGPRVVEVIFNPNVPGHATSPTSALVCYMFAKNLGKRASRSSSWC